MGAPEANIKQKFWKNRRTVIVKKFVKINEIRKILTQAYDR